MTARISIKVNQSYDKIVFIFFSKMDTIVSLITLYQESFTHLRLVRDISRRMSDPVMRFHLHKILLAQRISSPKMINVITTQK